MNAKPGWLTSEFALSLVCLVLIVLNKPLEIGIDPLVLLGLAGAALGYPISRGLAKQAPTTTTIVGPQETARVDNVTTSTTHARPPYPPGYPGDQ